MIDIAVVSDAIKLTEIALKSKSYWGYSDELLKSWTHDLTVSEKMIQEMIVCKFISDDKIIGFYILNQPKQKSIELEFLFVLPSFIGKGIGNQLLQHAFIKSKKLNCNRVTLLADPHAVSFYESKGFIIIGKKESAIVGRFLPLLQKDLE
ncbi:Ribosomal protein S18 acetylase RimI [Polaribacter sp. KT25b]|uniref:GNAT family N-acetyltransferase n=1 Tax=Polaribacter sp. KT25b TaxID=1855336 RepID=UPI0008794C40|nr:GNAT family N-acetyltransferase [Polaribacter sp. KT25b]SDR68851.1 Ribosomal protein S18 acetylase RimI [Polaribacter sp. KT25b]